MNKMKKRTFALLLLTVTAFVACKKDSVKPTATPDVVTQKVTTTTTGLNTDTVSENVTGYIRLQLAMDTVNTDNILIDFKPKSSAAFVVNEDAPTLQGFGLVSLSSLSSNNIALAINTLPLTGKGAAIALAVSAKSTGTYKLNLVTTNDIPAVFNIWLKDNLKKDSVNFRTAPSYSFNLNTADTTTYGNQRFSLVLSEN
jgi:hypothetical protein